MKEPYKLFGNIKKARVTSGLSQKDLAKRLGVSDKTVSAYETGRAIPPTPTLANIAEITGVSVSELMGVVKEDEITKRLDKIEQKINYIGSAPVETKDLRLDAFVGVVLKDEKDRIYLIREKDKHDITKKRWNLPGGSVDKDEGFIEAAIRETKEKTGFDITVNSLLGCYKCKKGHNSWIFIVFEGRLSGKESVKIDTDVMEGKWFDEKPFMELNSSEIVHPDMRLVYQIADENRGLKIDSVKYIEYENE